MNVFKVILITGIGVYLSRSKQVREFVKDTVGMGIHYTAEKWPDLSKKVRATSSKIVDDLYNKAEEIKRKRGDVA